jgi:biotin carboxylase
VLGTVLLLGNYRPTIVVVRSLARAGYRVIVGARGEGGAEHSRFTSEVWDHPAAGHATFVGTLRAFLQARPEVGIVFPVAEEYVRAVSAARASLPADRVYALPQADVVAAMIDKVRAYHIAESVGVPVASWTCVERPEDLEPACGMLGYPVVLRSVNSMRPFGSRKAVIVGTPRAVREIVRVWPEGRPRLLVQRWVDGIRHNVYFAANAGRIVRMADVDVARTDQPDTTGLAVAGRTRPVDRALHAFTAAITERVAYHGVGCAQFIVGRDGGPTTFLELNPRLGGNHAVPEASGVELSTLAIALAATDRIDVPFVAGRPGLRYAWTYGDLRGLRAARASGRVARRETAAWAWRIVCAFFAADVHMTWRWDDPLPTLALYARRVPGARWLVARRTLPAGSGAPTGNVDERVLL